MNRHRPPGRGEWLKCHDELILQGNLKGREMWARRQVHVRETLMLAVHTRVERRGEIRRKAFCRIYLWPIYLWDWEVKLALLTLVSLFGELEKFRVNTCKVDLQQCFSLALPRFGGEEINPPKSHIKHHIQPIYGIHNALRAGLDACNTYLQNFIQTYSSP